MTNCASSAVLAVFALVVAPSMKIDPAEMEKIQEEMKDSPFSFLMGGQPPTTGTSAPVTAGAVGAAKKAAPGAGKKKR
jgi:hypothetical protein